MSHKGYTLTILAASLLATASQTLAEGNSVSGHASVADWMDRLPVILAASIITIVIDIVFLVPALRRLRAGYRSGRHHYQTGG